jgi:hypothetical protein
LHNSALYRPHFPQCEAMEIPAVFAGALDVRVSDLVEDF